MAYSKGEQAKNCEVREDARSSVFFMSFPTFVVKRFSVWLIFEE